VSNPLPVKVCKVCRRALERNVAAGTGEETWEHHQQDSLSGHKAVPVDAEGGNLLGRCDFCNADLFGEKWVLPVSDFVAGRNPINGKMQGYEGDWMACGTCAPLIDGNRWTTLIRRVQQSWEDDHGLPAPEDKKTGWNVLYRLLRRNIRGSIYKAE
jgi:hypothetical protein